MPIDPNIALGFKLPQAQIQNPVAQYAQAQELGLNALRMQEAQQGMEVRNRLRALDPSSPEYINEVSRIDPKLGLELSKGRTQARTAEIDQRTKVGGLIKQYANRVIATPNLATAKSVLQQFARDTGEDVSSELATLDRIGENPDALRQWGMGYAATADQILAQTTITPAQQAQMNLTRRGQDITLRGQDLGRIPVGYRQTAGGEIEPIPGGPTTTTLSPKEMQIREAKRPQATLALKTFEDKTSTLEKDIKELMNHPGLPSITGIAAGRLPGITAEGRAAEALFNRIQKAGGFRELQEMRNASPTGGALGQVSNQENTSLQQTFAAIDRTQNASDVKKGLAKALDELTQSKRRVREAFDMTYDYRPSAPGGAAPSGADNDPLGIRK